MNSRRVATTPYAVAHRAVLRADVRQNTRQCAPGDSARTPQKGQSAGSPAAAAAAAGAQAEAKGAGPMEAAV